MEKNLLCCFIDCDHEKNDYLPVCMWHFSIACTTIIEESAVCSLARNGRN